VLGSLAVSASPEITAFLAALPAEHREAWPVAAIEELLARARAEARVWPSLRTELLAAWLGERVQAVSGPTSEGLELGSLVLACACVHGADGAAVAFRERHGPDIDAALRRLGLPSAEADDVRQAVLGKLLVAGSEKLRSYGGRGALGGWVRAVTVRQAISMGRRRAPLDRAQGEIPTQLPGLLDPEHDYLKARYGGELRRALREAVERLPAEDRNLLRFRFVDGLTLDELARVFDVHRATVARHLAKARADVRKATLRALRAELRLDGAEADSLVRMVRSQLDLSLSGLLGAGGE
jgi:RNA polymerase sigma-70 factor (ECF subfamily)